MLIRNMIDIVFPKDNEKKFIETAIKLDYKELIMAYSSEKDIKKISSDKIKIYPAILSKENDIMKNRKHGLVFVESIGKDRNILEKGCADILFNIEKNSGKDFMHQRGSGMDHVMCKLAADKNIVIGFSFSDILGNEKNKAMVLGRIEQNIRLYHKFKVKYVIGSFAKKPMEMRSYRDLIDFFRLVGAEKNKIEEGYKELRRRVSKKDDNVIYEDKGIKIEKI